MRMQSAERANSLAREIETYHAAVNGAGSYLVSRGISRRAADRFKLGFVPPGHDNKSIAGRLAIPYLHPLGAWHLKYRCIQSHNCKEIEQHVKYIYEPGIEQHLFNAQTLLRADRVVICEGELDAVTIEQCGFPAVAYPGAQTWKKARHWRWCFDSVEEVVIAADGDAPRDGQAHGIGEIEARAVAESLRSAIPGDVRVIVMPPGHDVNSYYVAHGDVELLQKLELI